MIIWVWFAVVWASIGVSTLAYRMLSSPSELKDPLFSRKEVLGLFVLFAAFGPIPAINQLEDAAIRRIRGKAMDELMK